MMRPSDPPTDAGSRSDGPKPWRRPKLQTLTSLRVTSKAIGAWLLICGGKRQHGWDTLRNWADKTAASPCCVGFVMNRLGTSTVSS